MAPKILAALAMLTLTTASTTQAADIELTPGGNKFNGSIISAKGDFVAGDAQAFRTLIKVAPKPVTVFLEENHGGSLLDGIDIGEAIRQSRADTVTVNYCYSACALAWLGGVTRMVSGRIGFHAAYLADTHETSGAANALVGFYIARLGYGPDVALWATAAGPDDILLLTAPIAQQLHLTATFLPHAKGN